MEAAVDEEDAVAITYERTKPSKDKQKPVRTELPAHLPREEQIIEPEDKPEGAVKIGETITEILEYRRGVMYVRKIIRPKYKVGTDSNSTNTEIVTASIPSLPIPGGNAGPCLLAYLLISISGNGRKSLAFRRRLKYLRYFDYAELSERLTYFI